MRREYNEFDQSAQISKHIRNIFYLHSIFVKSFQFWIIKAIMVEIMRKISE